MGLPCLNSGLIYRAVTVLVLDRGLDFEDEDAVARLIQEMELRFVEDSNKTRVFVGKELEISDRLRAPDVTPQIYRIANNPFYRKLLVDLQKRVAEPDGVVAEGRDMGTVIFPEADHKFFLDATAEERARRHHRDLVASGHTQNYEDLLREIRARDEHDRNREVGPLSVPEGAVVVDTEGLSVDEVVARVWSHVGKQEA